MKRKNSRYAWVLIALIPVPFIYNSCQQAPHSSSSNTASSCGLEKGIVTKLGDSEPGVFSAQKVRLKDDLSMDPVQGKAVGPVMVAAGKRLSVIVDNVCVKERQHSLRAYPLTEKLVANGKTLEGLDRQAYEWRVEETVSDEQLEAQLQAEPCIVGLSWDNDYELAAFSFNDAAMGQQNHLNAIQATQSYDRFYNSNGGLAFEGAPVIVAVIDTGVDWQHPDLAGNMWSHQYGVGIDATTMGTALINYNPYDISPQSHGTHLAGIIAAQSNNGTGIVVTMPFRARIMAIKIFKANATTGQPESTTSHLYNGIQFAAANGADVINLSVAAIRNGAATDSVTKSAIDHAVNIKGIVVTTVIGNTDAGQTAKLIDGVNWSSYPAQFSTKAGVIGVGSIDSSTLNKSDFSHYSTTFAEIAAPGSVQGTSQGIYSTVLRTKDSYGRLAGTSQAAPMVAAAAALTIGIIRDAHGGVKPTPAEVERLILASAKKSSNLTSYFKDGNRLDLLSLATLIGTEYPKTKTAPGVPAPPVNPQPGCP